MAKGDGLFFVLIGLIGVIASLFFKFFDNGASSYQASEAVVWMVQNLSSYFDILQNSGTLFPDHIFAFFIIINPLFLLIGVLCVLIGLNTKSSARLGASILLIFPIVYLVFQVIIPLIEGIAFTTLFSYIQVGFYLELIGALLIIIGAVRNGEYH
jgi:hypothetical protein